MKREIMSIIGVSLLAVGLCGCAGKKEMGTVRYLNFKPEVADVWEEIATEYTAETGIPVEILNAPSNSNEQTLKAEIAKKNPPTLFQINGPVGFRTWKNYCRDMSDTQLYSWVVDKNMVITGDDGGVYAIPYVVEGYGIIYNNAIMSKYFSLGGKGTNINSIEEINTFDKLKSVAQDMTKHKSELGIDGVFASTSLAAGEEWRWQTHLMNLPVYYEYKDKGVDDLDNLEFTYSTQFQNIFDLYTNNSCTDKSQLGNKTVNDSMEEFALGKCAMVQNGNWAWGQIASVEGNTVSEDNCKFMPIYIGAPGEESQGLCIGTECYMCVNKIASEADQKASIDFLEWLFSSDTGKKYVTNDLQFITVFNTFSAQETPSNPLARQVAEYINDTSKSSVSWNFTTFPSQTFKDKLSEELYKYVKGEETMDGIKTYVVDEWKAEKQQ